MSEKSDILKEISRGSGKKPSTVPEDELMADAKKKSDLLNLLKFILPAIAVLAVLCLVFTLVMSGRNTSSAAGSSSSSAASSVVKPSLASDTMDGTNCIITLKKGTYDIAWDSIYAKDSSGNQVKPAAVDKNSSTVTFSLESGTLNIYIPDTQGNESRLVLQPGS